MAPTRARTIEELSQHLENHMSKINSRFDDLERKYNKIIEENKELKEANNRLQKEMLGLSNHINSLEQYQRNYSVRINNLQLPDNIASDPNKVKEFVYRSAIAPILQGAIEKGDLAGMPSAHQTLELAHVLPGKQGKPKPIIARFLNRNDRALVLRYKKQFAPRDTVTSKHKHPIFEDLTRDSFKLLMRLSNDDRIESAWTMRGVIKYKKAGSNTIYKVDNIFLPFEDHFGAE